MKKCERCHEMYEDSVGFCPRCGQPTQTVHLCPGCGAEVPGDARFCTNCGRELSGSAASAATSEAGQMASANPAHVVDTAEQSASVNQAFSADAKDQAASTDPAFSVDPAGQAASVNQAAAADAANQAAAADAQPAEMPQTRFRRMFVPGLVVLGVLLLLTGITLGVSAHQKGKMRDYIAAYEKKAESFVSLGKYENTWNAYRNEAKSFHMLQYLFRTNGQIKKMKSLEQQIQTLNDRVGAYQKTYDEVVETLETSGKYFLADSEEEYTACKEKFEENLEAFDVKKCADSAEKFETLCTRIKKENKETCEDWIDGSRSDKDNLSFSHCLQTLSDEYISKMQSAYEQKEYGDVQERYEAFREFYNSAYDGAQADSQVTEYAQIDTSGKGEVNLYFQSDEEDLALDPDSFLLYERGTGRQKWKQCEVQDIQQVRDKGGLSIDILADVSSSMDSNGFYTFSDVQNAMSNFVGSVDDSTRLGLAEISTTYNRYCEFTTDTTSVNDTIYSLSCYGSTALYYSLYSSVMYTASSTGSRCVVAFTDGQNVPYDETIASYGLDDVVEAANTYHVPVYIIGIGDYVNTTDLQYIADNTGGGYWSISDIYDLSDIYQRIYNAQQSMYRITYNTSLKTSRNRDVYVGYYDNVDDFGISIEQFVDAQALNAVYESNVTSDDLTTYYSRKKLLTAEEVSNLSLEDIQTVINIYYAKNGYHFNTARALKQMKELGVIRKNGRSGTDPYSRIKKNKKLFKNYKMLIKQRTKIIYDATRDAYYPGISKGELVRTVHENLGESNRARYKASVVAAWKNIKKYGA